MNDAALRVFARHFREWYAEHFEDFAADVNAQLLCLDNEAATALGDEDDTRGTARNAP